MSDQPKKRWPKRLGVIATILVMYVLSFGPAGLIVYSTVPFRYFDTASEVMDFIYAPLIWLAERSELFDSVMAWYVDLWTP